MRLRQADKVRPIPTNEHPKRPRKTGSKPKPAGGASFEPLKTERLTLRPLRPNDAEAMHRLVNDWEVTRTLAEELGLDDVWVSEHIIVPKDAPYPPSPNFWDPVLTLTWAAAISKACSGTGSSHLHRSPQR